MACSLQVKCIYLVWFMQAVNRAATVVIKTICMFSPSVLRQALRRRANIVTPSKADAVVSYVMSDDRIDELHGLFLIRMSDDSLHELVWTKEPRVMALAEPHSAVNCGFFYDDKASEETYN